jgi:hypothetical protein
VIAVVRVNREGRRGGEQRRAERSQDKQSAEGFHVAISEDSGGVFLT